MTCGFCCFSSSRCIKIAGHGTKLVFRIIQTKTTSQFCMFIWIFSISIWITKAFLSFCCCFQISLFFSVLYQEKYFKVLIMIHIFINQKIIWTFVYKNMLSFFVTKKQDRNIWTLFDENNPVVIDWSNEWHESYTQTKCIQNGKRGRMIFRINLNNDDDDDIKHQHFNWKRKESRYIPLTSIVYCLLPRSTPSLWILNGWFLAPPYHTSFFVHSNQNRVETKQTTKIVEKNSSAQLDICMVCCLTFLLFYTQIIMMTMMTMITVFSLHHHRHHKSITCHQYTSVYCIQICK